MVLDPAPASVEFKMLAAVGGYNKYYLPTEREAEQLTGLQAGGISPLALINKGFSVIIDSSVKNLSRVHISGGQRGLNIKLSVDDLARLTNAHFAFVCTKR
jgi:Cys-tRNA(Pro)/Cys-tRNA(Cys) deacylase